MTAFSKSGFWLDWKRDGVDPAASLLQAYTRVLAEAKPRYFILENVYALTFNNRASKPAFERLLSEEYAKLRGATNRDVHDDSKNTTLPIAREIVARELHHGFFAPQAERIAGRQHDLAFFPRAQALEAHFERTGDPFHSLKQHEYILPTPPKGAKPGHLSS